MKKVNIAKYWIEASYPDYGGILSDALIRELVKIDPFVDYGQCPQGVITYGLTSYGYDMRIDKQYKVFTDVHCGAVDPKNFDKKSFIDVDGDYCLIPPHSFALGVSVETFEIPRDILAICVGKSTYARTGIIINVTPLEPGWRGKVTLEISNTTPLPVKVYSNEGIAQIVFHKGITECELDYEDKKGRYQDQKELTLPFVVGLSEPPGQEAKDAY